MTLERVNQYYLANLYSVQEQLGVRAAQDIYAANGIKLLAKGTRIDSRVGDILSAHRLRKPLEVQIQLDDTDLPTYLRNELKAILQDEPLVMQWLGVDKARELMRHVINTNWPVLASQALQLMQVRYPRLLRHHLRALAIAWPLLPSARYQQTVLYGCLLHDVGYLYIDPEIWQKKGPLTPQEWRQFDSHPLVGFIWACELQAVPADVSQIILQHHERIDGSGYPRQLSGDAMHTGAEVVAVAEMISGIMEHARQPVGQLMTALKLLPAQFSDGIRQEAARLAHALPREQDWLIEGDVLESALHQVLLRFSRMQDVLLEIDGQVVGEPGRKLFAYLLLRLRSIQQAFNSVGLAMMQKNGVNAQGEDGIPLMQELALVIAETNWLTRHLSRDLVRQRMTLSPEESELFEPLAILFLGLSEELTLAGL